MRSLPVKPLYHWLQKSGLLQQLYFCHSESIKKEAIPEFLGNTTELQPKTTYTDLQTDIGIIRVCLD